MDNCENPQYISPEDVVEAMPFEKGDSILVASDVSEFLMAAFLEGKHFDLDHLIDLIQEKLTSDGTLLFPTYNWKFCSGKVFDYHKTKSRTGALSQKALKRPDFVRTTHPLYSFAVWGKDAEYLHSLLNINSFVGGTPFEYLNDTKQSKMLMLDVDSRCFTFQHYVEERVHAPYRYLKKFTAPYIDENGCLIKPEKENGYKFETLVVDMVRLMDDTVPFEVVREEEFAPIKNLHGVDSLDSSRELMKKAGIRL